MGRISNKDWCKKFGERLDDEMRYRGLTESYLSAITGFSERSICNWRNGKSTPSAYAMDVLCKTLGLEYDELYPKSY
jgi:transcriptional regulator with XRE-family HTH domain